MECIDFQSMDGIKLSLQPLETVIFFIFFPPLTYCLNVTGKIEKATFADLFHCIYPSLLYELLLYYLKVLTQWVSQAQGVVSAAIQVEKSEKDRRKGCSLRVAISRAPGLNTTSLPWPKPKDNQMEGDQLVAGFASFVESYKGSLNSLKYVCIVVD